MIEVSAHIGIAKITKSTEVQARMKGFGGTEYHNGAIYVECPELGFVEPNLLYCRYGLSLPYVQIEPGDKIWIQPTIEGQHRWCYIGFADRGEGDQEEPFVKGATFKSEFDKNIEAITELQNAIKNWSPVSQDGGAALKSALTDFCSKVIAESDDILSQKIIGE